MGRQPCCLQEPLADFLTPRAPLPEITGVGGGWIL